MKDFFEYKGFVSHIIKALTVFVLGLIFITVMSPSSYASDKSDEMIAAEMIRQAQCAEIKTASVSTKCGIRNGGVSGFGFNLPDDYSATEAANAYEASGKAEERWIESRYETADRLIIQYRLDHTNQIKTIASRTEVYLKTAFGLRRVQ